MEERSFLKELRVGGRVKDFRVVRGGCRRGGDKMVRIGIESY